MSQYSDPYAHSGSNPPSPPQPPQPPSIAAPGGGPYQPRPQVVHVVSKPGGFWRAMGIMASLFLFAIVFFMGFGFGIMVMIVGASVEEVMVRQTYRDGDSRVIAVIPIEGVIDARQADFVHSAVEDVLDDRRVQAVVLRVDSPGGGVTPSDQIWYEVNRLKDKGLPVIASYGSVAASGGYYVSCGADSIMAEQTTITGSIGVIAQVLTLEGLMGKIGVEPVTLVATGSPEKAVANDVFRAWDERDKDKVRTMLDSAYATFRSRVEAGRKAVITDSSTLNGIANGSIYTSEQAKANGLIDGIGYMDDAIALAEQRAGLRTGAATVEILRWPPTLMGALLGAEASAPAGSHQSIGSSLNADSIRALVNDLAMPRVMYLMH